MITFECGECDCVLKCPESLAGTQIVCGRCKTKLIVPEEDKLEPPKPTVIVFKCKDCKSVIRAEEGKKRVLCRTCKAPNVVPVEEPAEIDTGRTMPRRDEESRAPVSTQETTSTGGGISPAVFLGVLLIVVGLVCFGAAFKMNDSLNKQDSASTGSSNALFDFNVGLNRLAGRPYAPVSYKSPEKESRTPVYLIAGIGVVFVAAGFICLAIGANQSRAAA